MSIVKNLSTFYNFNNKWLNIFLLIAIPRIIYTLFTNNITEDSNFYLDVAENIKNGCRFSYTNSLGDCEPVIGGYFPGYPYFLYAAKLIGFTNKITTIFVSILTTISIIYLLKTLSNIGVKEKKLFIFALLIGLSPISIGYSRFILIDPILNIFSILLLTEFIKLKNKSKNIRINLLKILFLSIFAIYFKPTSIILVFPHFFLFLTLFGIKKFLKISIIYSLILSLSILPWGLRDLSYGSNKLFIENSNVAPS